MQNYYDYYIIPASLYELLSDFSDLSNYSAPVDDSNQAYYVQCDWLDSLDGVDPAITGSVFDIQQFTQSNAPSALWP